MITCAWVTVKSQLIVEPCTGLFVLEVSYLMLDGKMTLSFSFCYSCSPPHSCNGLHYLKTSPFPSIFPVRWSWLFKWVGLINQWFTLRRGIKQPGEMGILDMLIQHAKPSYLRWLWCKNLVGPRETWINIHSLSMHFLSPKTMLYLWVQMLVSVLGNRPSIKNLSSIFLRWCSRCFILIPYEERLYVKNVILKDWIAVNCIYIYQSCPH